MLSSSEGEISKRNQKLCLCLELKYHKKYKDLKRKVREFEDENAKIGIKLEKAKLTIQRLRLERSFLYEKLESTNKEPVSGAARSEFSSDEQNDVDMA